MNKIELPIGMKCEKCGSCAEFNEQLFTYHCFNCGWTLEV